MSSGCLSLTSQNGWAATARFNTKLADVANVTATGSFVSAWASAACRTRRRPNARLDNVLRGDLNATVAADKFLLPDLRLGIKVPVLLQTGKESRAPLSTIPLDPDTKLDPVPGQV